MKCGHLILRKIFRFVATGYQILRLKCTQFNFGWGSAPDPAGGAYSAPLREGRGSGDKWEDEIEKGRRAEEKRGEGREGQGWLHTRMCEILKKYPDCRTDLIDGGGNSDV